ncbi:MAG: [acyl-carrier-protein] S-malonyltransferase [Candidatus Marinimicrobia bacterium]|nr:[acyl-carrier-protein] S-malonyltransferase [Candidatus Neomarinimicrobiota bacterium]|tara:strand:+ start:15422 stop:16348 length:927 start_codon:yes stop_codon:yes gene_type:complete
MKALLFPGQGSQFVGMGKDLYSNFDIVKKTFQQADEKLNYNLSKIFLEGPEEELKLTKNTQPAILTISYSIFKLIRDEFKIEIKDLKYFAGHSLGEYSALVCSGSLDFLDALYLLHERGKSMQEAVPKGTGSMLAVMGIKTDELESIISKLDKNLGVCEIANDNSENQIILSGHLNSINEISKVLKNMKKRSILLPVSAPFHCSLMKPAAEKMEKKINNTNFKNPNINLIANVTAKEISDPNKIKNLLVQQIVSKVRWRESILYMIDNGIKEFIEIGPGKVLSGLVKRINDKVLTKSINTIDDVKNLK